MHGWFQSLEDTWKCPDPPHSPPLPVNRITLSPSWKTLTNLKRSGKRNASKCQFFDHVPKTFQINYDSLPTKSEVYQGLLENSSTHRTGEREACTEHVWACWPMLPGFLPHQLIHKTHTDFTRKCLGGGLNTFHYTYTEKDFNVNFSSNTFCYLNTGFCRKSEFRVQSV